MLARGLADHRAELAARWPELTVSATMSGIQTAVLGLVPKVTLATGEQAGNYLERCAKLGGCLDQAGDRLRAGLAAGRTPPALGVRAAIRQLDTYLAGPVADDPLLTPTPPPGADGGLARTAGRGGRLLGAAGHGPLPRPAGRRGRRARPPRRPLRPCPRARRPGRLPGRGRPAHHHRPRPGRAPPARPRPGRRPGRGVPGAGGAGARHRRHGQGAGPAAPRPGAAVRLGGRDPPVGPRRPRPGRGRPAGDRRQGAARPPAGSTR